MLSLRPSRLMFRLSANISAAKISSSVKPTPASESLEIAPRPKEELQFDKQTHTGQAWDQDDYRLARFVQAPKQVNPNFAVNLIAQVPAKACHDRVVFCDGGGGPLGHPKIYINLDKPGNHACGYCGLRFYLDGNQANEEHIQV